MKIPSLRDQSPERQLAYEINRLSSLNDDAPKMHGQYMLYTPRDPNVPYVDYLSGREVLISNAMGDREAYRYISAGKDLVHLTSIGDGGEVVEELKGDKASEHATFLAQFGKVEKSNKDKLEDVRFKVLWLSGQVDRMISFGLRMGVQEAKARNESFCFPGHKGKPTVTGHSRYLCVDGPAIVINRDTDSKFATVGFVRKSSHHYREHDGYKSKDSTNVSHSIVHLTVDQEELEQIQRTLSPSQINEFKSSEEIWLPTINDDCKDKQKDKKLNIIKLLRRQLYANRLTASSSLFEKRLKELEQAAKDKELNPLLAKSAKYELTT